MSVCNFFPDIKSNMLCSRHFDAYVKNITDNNRNLTKNNSQLNKSQFPNRSIKINSKKTL